jgi:hypothetical protein
MRPRASLIFFSAGFRGSPDGKYARSISTDNRGMSRTKRLIAVPPFNAKQVSAATCGIVLSINSACLKYGFSFKSGLRLRSVRSPYPAR